ncbi:Peptidase family M20/M25/M40 [compost metagenome]
MDGYPYLINEEKVTASARAFAADYLGEENVIDLDIWMAAEDFAYYSQITDACFYRLGTGSKEKDTCYSVHTPNFDIDEDALKVSTGLMAYMAVKQLGN